MVVVDFSLVLDISAVIREAKSMMERWWLGRWGFREVSGGEKVEMEMSG